MYCTIDKKLSQRNNKSDTGGSKLQSQLNGWYDPADKEQSSLYSMPQIVVC